MIYFRWFRIFIDMDYSEKKALGKNVFFSLKEEMPFWLKGDKI